MPGNRSDSILRGWGTSTLKRIPRRPHGLQRSPIRAGQNHKMLGGGFCANVGFPGRTRAQDVTALCPFFCDPIKLERNQGAQTKTNNNNPEP